MLRHPRVSVLAACALLFACGGDPAPKQVESPRPAKIGHSKKKHKNEDAEAPASDKEDKQRELDREAEKEKEERAERKRKREQEEAADDKQVAASDDSGGSSEDADDKSESSDDGDAKAEDAKAKKKAEQDEAKAKKKAAREEALAKKKAAREEAAAKKKAAAEEAKAKKLAAAEAKKNKNKKKKGKDDEDGASDSSEGEPTKSDDETTTAADEKDKEKDTADEAPKAKKKPAKESKAKKKVAKADDKKANNEDEADADEAPPKKDSDEQSDTSDDDAKPKKLAKGGKARKGKKEPAKADKKPDKKDDKKDDAKVDDDSIDMEETTTAVRDPSHDSDELDLTSKPTADTEPVSAAPPPPLAIDRRPLTTASGKLETHGGLRVASLTSPNGMGGSTTVTSEGFGLGATYGAGAKAEVGLDYTVGLHPGSAKGPLLLHGAYRVVEGDKLDMAIAAGFAVDFVTVVDPTTKMSSTQTATGLQIGGWVRYHVGRTLSVFTGLPALPSSSGSLSKVAALPPLPYQLSIGFSRGGAIGLDLPVGAGYQATPKIYAFASLDLAHIGMSNTTSAFVFADFIPLALGGFYAAGKVDIGAIFGDDLKRGADYLHLDIVARYYLK